MKCLTKCLLALCVSLAVLAAPVAAWAQEQLKPVAIVSLASLEETLADIGYVTTAAGMEDTGKTVRLLTSGLTAGIDRTRPMGLYVVPQAGDFHAVAFLPVSDLKLLLQVHSDQIGEPKDAGGGILEIGKDEKAYIKEQAGWAFVAQSQDHLGNLPADPVTLLGDLPKKYNVAAKLMVQNVPEELRRMAIDEIKVGAARFLSSPAAQQGNLDRAQTEQMLQGSIGGIERLINESDELFVGLAIDAQGKNVALDLGLSAKEGTPLAKQMALQQDSKTQFAGLMLPGAAAQMHVVSKSSPEDIAQVKQTFKMLHDQIVKQIDDSPEIQADKRGPIKAVVGQFLSIFEKTVESGKLDGGASLVLAPKSVTFVAGGYIADGAAMEKALKDLVDLAAGSPNFPQVEFNAGTHGGAKLHRLAMPIPEQEPQARELFGEKLEIVVATGQQSVIIAGGKDAEGTLKKAIDDSAAAGEKAVPPGQFVISLLPILKFSSSVDANPIIADLVSTLENSGNDKLTIVSEAGPRSSRTRIEIQEGIIKVIGNAVKAFGGGQNAL